MELKRWHFKNQLINIIYFNRVITNNFYKSIAWNKLCLKTFWL